MSQKWVKGRWLLIVLLFTTVFSIFAMDRLRSEGVVYLEDYLDKPVELKALQTTFLTISQDGRGILGTLVSNQFVRLVGIRSDHFLIEAQITRSRGEGWVVPSNFEPIPEAVLKELQQKIDEAKKIKQAITRGEIEIGMPQEAVLKILGKPISKSSITEAEGTVEQWTYATYKTLPLYFPSVVNTTIRTTNSVSTTTGTTYSTLYRKVPVGTKVVTFHDKKVIRFETKQDETIPQRGSIEVPPIYVQ